MNQNEKVTTQSHWENGNVKYEQVEQGEYGMFISRMYSPNGMCLDESLIEWGRYSGLVKVFLKEKKIYYFGTKIEGQRQGVSVALLAFTPKKTFKSKLKALWKRFF